MCSVPSQLTSLPLELQKFGASARGWLYIQLLNFPSHYLVLVITDDEFRYALISVEVLTETMYAKDHEGYWVVGCSTDTWRRCRRTCRARPAGSSDWAEEETGG